MAFELMKVQPLEDVLKTKMMESMPEAGLFCDDLLDMVPIPNFQKRISKDGMINSVSVKCGGKEIWVETGGKENTFY